MNNRLKEVLNYMPENLKSILFKTFEQTGDIIQEIRIRNKSPLIINCLSGSFAVLPDGTISPAVGGAYIISPSELNRIFCSICENSVYAYAEDIKQGFITIKGGHRVGITGRANTVNGRIESFKEISSLNIRIAREVIGAANSVIDNVVQNGVVYNTLLVAPPMGGKTTVLRDLARQISDMGVKTALVDERGELASIYCGVPQNNIGLQTDVIENVPKAEGALLLLRTMSPQLIITDEISTQADANALIQCFGLGVSVIASTHGSSIDEVKNRLSIKPLLGGNGFNRIILLTKEGRGINTGIIGRAEAV